jgi:uncharacterized protein YodC (DUF2158 family)
MNQFKLADIVRLKSGGPRMTISDEMSDDHRNRDERGRPVQYRVRCDWFAGANRKSGIFEVAILVAVEDGTGTKS